MWKLFCALYLITITQNVKGDGMIEVFKWKQMDFYNRGYDAAITPPTDNRKKDSVIFPDQRHYSSRPSYQQRYKRASMNEKVTSRDQPISLNSRSNIETTNMNNQSYIPYNNIPMGATHFNGRLFVTMPRRRIGIPSTLNYIDMIRDSSQTSPKLHAYPNFDTNQLSPNNQPNPNRIISVYRTTVDACKRLWFIDTGMLEYPDNRVQVQNPSIWIIDLTTDTVVRRFEIPQSVAETGRGLASITIDVNRNQCGQAFAYLPDLVYNQLYVYSFQENKIWTFSHNYFNFDPLGGDLSIGGQQFRWDDGIFSTTLGPLQNNGERNVYFHAMASNNEFFVSNMVLQNEMNAGRSDHGNDFKVLGSRGARHQSTMHEYDERTGTIFYDEIQRNGIGCWNTNKEFSPANHGNVHQDAERMIYPSDLTIDEDGMMWVMSNSMPIFIYSNLDPNVYNFRIWSQSTKKAIKNTVCQN